MIWAHSPFLSSRIRMGCPVLELFHPYKKLLENIWKQPEFFYTLFAPIRHSYNPSSKIFAKPKLKEIEAVSTTLALIWPGYRPQFHHLLAAMEDGKRRTHLRNIILVLDFFLPIVCPIFFSCLRLSMCTSTACLILP